MKSKDQWKKEHTKALPPRAVRKCAVCEKDVKDKWSAFCSASCLNKTFHLGFEVEF